MKKRRSARQTNKTETQDGAILQVQGPKVQLFRDGVPQSSLDLDEPETLDFEYMQHMDLILGHTVEERAWEGERLRAYHAGAGALALPLAWHARFPRMTQLAVDTDQDLVQTVRRLARLDRLGRVRMRAADAEKVLLGSNATYNVIVRDAFTGEDTPKHLQSLAFHRLVRSRLRSGGLYLANVGDNSLANAKRDIAGIAETFRNLIVVGDPAVWRGKRIGNLVVAAWNGSAPDLSLLDREVRSQPLVVRLYSTATVRNWLGGSKPVDLEDPSLR